jgi:four helix bundle protein
MHVYSFEKLDVWQRSIDLVKDIYLLTKSFPDDEKFGIISQVRRAAVSVPNNISEGTSRTSPKDQANFIQLAYSSLMEVLNLMIVSKRLQYINEDQYLPIREAIEEISNKLNALRTAQLRKIR